MKQTLCSKLNEAFLDNIAERTRDIFNFHVMRDVFVNTKVLPRFTETQKIVAMGSR